MALVRTAVNRLRNLRADVWENDVASSPSDDERALASQTDVARGRRILPGTFGWSYVRPLLGTRRGPIVGLIVASVVTGVTEAGILARVSEVAVALVDGSSRAHIS